MSFSDVRIIIDKSIASEFDLINNISFIRYNYYHPAYNLMPKGKFTKSYDDDNNLIIHYERISNGE